MIEKNVERVLRQAYDLAVDRKHEYLCTEHLLLSMLDDKEVMEILDKLQVDFDRLRSDLNGFLDGMDQLPDKVEKTPEQTLSFQRVLRRALLQASGAGKKEVRTPALLVSIYDEPESFSSYALITQNITKLDLLSLISHGLDQDRYEPSEETEITDHDDAGFEEKAASAESELEGFAQNLNELALEGAIDPLLGRKDELERLFQILARRKKNNAVLVGEPGVGKTAIAYGLAKAVVDGEVPELLEHVEVYSLDLGSMIAGTKFRGQFEERFKKVLKTLKSKGNVVLYISEIHNIVDSGVSSGSSMGAANLLKPALAEGWLRCIGSTTYKEFRNYFEKDSALVRRFQVVDVAEPSRDEAIDILNGLKDKYEDFHKLTYEKKAIESAVDLSSKYINERFLPDKAIDLIDELGAKGRLANQKKVGEKEVELLVSKIAKIPPPNVRSKTEKSLKDIEKKIAKFVYGQKHAIEKVSQAIKIARAGLRDSEKPTGCFLFSGPTGVGKTELAKQLASNLGIKFLRFDMSEYMESHAVSRLIGAPPGYVGYDQGGLLTEQIRKNPHAVLLLDEIEKAHVDIYNVLLQVMDRAVLTDNSGREADFRNIILIMTTNAGSRELAARQIGFGGSELSSDDDKSIRRVFSPEFIGRLDARIAFEPLPKTVMSKIVDKKILELNDLLKPKNVIVKLKPAARKRLSEVGYDPRYGARPLAKKVDILVKQPLSEKILFGKLKKGGVCEVDYKANEFVFELAEESEAVLEEA